MPMEMVQTKLENVTECDSDADFNSARESDDPSYSPKKKTKKRKKVEGAETGKPGRGAKKAKMVKVKKDVDSGDIVGATTLGEENETKPKIKVIFDKRKIFLWV